MDYRDRLPCKTHEVIEISRFMKPLTADIHFYTAMLDRTPIAVFIAGEPHWQRNDRGTNGV